MSSTMNKTALFAALLAMASSASAHMFMKSPVPFEGAKKDPLAGDGSNFPCQGSGYQITAMNDWAVGSKQTLSFPDDQTAVHGGGSCQISVTKDEKPTKNSVWKVIHSIEGGCPSDSTGNIDTQGGTVGTYDFEVPAELPEGTMTMAWTWFNHVGNREMYMNCAPIKVSGGTGKGFDNLPDMATCNIGNGCSTTEGSDYTFANPGKSVVKLGNGPFAGLGGGAASGSGSIGGSGSPIPAPSAPAAPSTPALKEPTTPAATTPKAPSTGSSSCPENGALLCNGESQFGLCSNGAVIYQPVAAGTKCSGGKITRRELHRNARSAIPPY
ncbi:lytic polysaccharide monooxygenase [Didymella exigua CBS 183.55]|uniref:Lytic polysaccharide monooxygenase n=1 Tax=Didymella exigua CBS 183.55 TaxID=1150837 RepID=A0A6A5RR11_9PLEO|nr:lytic polysaccharide monooxygenase [Didymella exigua CBS 183.55]KAF1930785.1 lytic polysaccharide monooxygenase [Didymella exigua CBS 183.55]